MHPCSLVLGLNAEDDSVDASIANTAIDTRDVDSIIAKELSSLSMQDLEKVYSDVHCLSSEVPESPELVRECLRQLDHELQKIPEKTAFDLARSMNFNYVDNVKFRLQFLRADRMNPARAAERLVRHFQAKLELFGMSMLARDITQDDLDDEALKCLMTARVRLYLSVIGQVDSSWFRLLNQPALVSLPNYGAYFTA